jgi:hypothetical protein
MAFPIVLGVHLLPATGEFVYDTIPYFGFQRGASGFNNGTNMNTLSDPTGGYTDYRASMDQLQAQHPECVTVSLVVAWFFNSLDCTQCNIYPSTNFILGEFLKLAGGPEVPPPTGNWVQDHWQCSSLTEQSFPGLIPLPALPGTDQFVYGGTPADQSVVRCIQDLKSRGFKVAFYPFLLGTGSGYPWRGDITYPGADISQAATNAVADFMGPAQVSDFTPNSTNLTVAYSGNVFDWTYRRMILHYANLCTVAGGVSLFVIGSELRSMEILRGPNWTPAGQTDGSGNAIWDYPFVAALQQLAADVRTTFDNLGCNKNTTTFENLITYSADWSSWMGWQPSGGDGQWPHLDSLWADSNIDFVSFDNYLPLTDWTTSVYPLGGLDAAEWQTPVYTGSWPPPSNQLSGLGLSGPPSIYSMPYVKGQIESGQYFNWYYLSGASGAHGQYGPDPLGSGLQVTVPTGDRGAQSRNAYSANQQILAPKQLRWWWNNPHYAVYANAEGAWVPQGPQTEWVPNSKSIITLEYGVPAVDKGTNQPNVFYDPKSVESATPFWSIWVPAPNLGYVPLRDDTIQAVGLEAIYEYWNVDGNNITVGGLPMLNWNFCCAWNWDARPFPTWPINSSAWGDTEDWQQGDWVNGLRVNTPPPAPTPPPTPPAFETFPTLAALGWSVHIKPRFSTLTAEHVSGREVRGLAYANPYFDIELTYEVLRLASASAELQEIAGFFEAMSGADTPFWFAPPSLSGVTGQAIGTGDGSTTVFPLQASIGPWTGPVNGTSGVSAVYLNGVSQASAWSVSAGYAPAITFTTAPSAGVTITADFGALWLCRFADDVQDFEEFMVQLFELRTLRLMTVRP